MCFFLVSIEIINDVSHLPDTLQILSSCGENESKYLSTSLSIVKKLHANNHAVINVCIHIHTACIFCVCVLICTNITFVYAFHFVCKICFACDRENIASANGQHISIQ